MLNLREALNLVANTQFFFLIGHHETRSHATSEVLLRSQQSVCRLSEAFGNTTASLLNLHHLLQVFWLYQTISFVQKSSRVLAQTEN